MRRHITHKIITIILIFIAIAPAFIQNIEFSTAGGVGMYDPEVIVVDKLFITNEEGVYNWQMIATGYPFSYPSSYLQFGTFDFTPRSSYSSVTNCYLDGTATSGFQLSMYSFETLALPSGQHSTPPISFYFKTNCYLLNNSVDHYTDTDLGTNGVIYFSCNAGSYYGNSSLDFDADISYQLKLNLQISSEYYDLSNVKIYTVESSEITQQDPYNIILTNPLYKIQIKNTAGDLLYSDSSDQYFSHSRTITIDSIQVSNNADEVIQTDFYATDDFVAKQFNNNAFEKSLITNQSTTDYTLTYDSMQLIGDHLSVLSLYSNTEYSQVQFYNLFSDYSEMYQFTEISFWFYTERDVSFLFHNSYYNRLAFLNVNSSQYTVNLTNYDPGSGPMFFSTDQTFLNYSQWYLFKISLGVMSVSIYNDEMTLIDTFTNTTYTQSSISYPKWEHVGTTQSCIYLDSICTNLNPTYYTEPNYVLNETAQSLENNLIYSDFYSRSYTLTNATNVKIESVANYANRNNVYNISAYASLVSGIYIGSSGSPIFPLITDKSFDVSFYVYLNNLGSAPVISFRTGSYYYFRIYMRASDTIFRNYDTNYYLSALSLSAWHYIRVVSNSTYMNLYIDNVSVKIISNNHPGTENNAYSYCYFSEAGLNNFYLDSFMANSTATYYTHSNTQLNYTASTFSSSANLSLQTNPYSQTISNISNVEEYLYTHSDLYDNELNRGIIDFNSENSLTYTPAYTVQNFISLNDQSNNYIDWENYKLKINDNLIYSNIFYEELNEIVNVSVYTRYNQYLTSVLHTVNRVDNYISITLNRYSLKIFNQQQNFMHYNISLDPNYYPTASIFWSEWVSQNEISELKLAPDRYRIILMQNETGTPNYASYSLNFVSDDILLISSSNTIFNVLQNINNLNSSINQQFSYVQLNFTNTNSYINQQTVLISLNFENYNTTIEDLLLSQQNSFEFMNTTLNNMYSEMSNSFEFSNSTLNNLYQLNQNSFTYTNSSLNSILLYTENSFDFVNSTLNSLNSITQNSFNYLNSSIENMNAYMYQNFTFTNSLINQNQLDILTQFSLVNSNISQSEINIANNILAINSSISEMINSLSSNVLLVNNSIYSAVLNSETNILFEQNQIAGNVSVIFQQNEFLTELYKTTMFSSLLNWTDVGYNTTLLEEQIRIVDFVNSFKNETIQIFLEYENQIENFTIAATESISKYIPSQNVSYSVRSISTGETLEEWTDLTNKTIDIGFYEEIVPATPEVVQSEINDWILTIIGIIAVFAVIIAIIVRSRNNLQKKLDNKRYSNVEERF